MTLDEFFTALEQSGLRFKKFDRSSLEEERSIIRDDNEFCPICALHAHLGYGIRENRQYYNAGGNLGLSLDDTAEIVKAADQSTEGYDKKVRAKLEEFTDGQIYQN